MQQLRRTVGVAAATAAALHGDGIDWQLRRWLREKIFRAFDVLDVSNVFGHFRKSLDFLDVFNRSS